MNRWNLVVSCEHASNRIPYRFSYLFREAENDLKSHLGWDPGALSLASALASRFEAPFFHYDFTRLLIEPNRSVNHPQLFSKYSFSLDHSVRKYLIATYYVPYRKAVKQAITTLLNQEKSVIHISVHTFTPVLDGVPRQVEIGLLYDEGRKREAAFCKRWKYELEQNSSYSIRLNEPYNGADDGLTTTLRNKLPKSHYLGIELEVSQALARTRKMPALVELFTKTLNQLILSEGWAEKTDIM